MELPISSCKISAFSVLACVACPDNSESWPGHLSRQPSFWAVCCSSVNSAHWTFRSLGFTGTALLSPPCHPHQVLLVTEGASAFAGNWRAEGWSLCQDTEEANHARDPDLINIVLEPKEPAFHGIVWLWIVSTDLWSRDPYSCLLREADIRANENVRDNWYFLLLFNSLTIGLWIVS